jgi:hypothetical protein
MSRTVLSPSIGLAAWSLISIVAVGACAADGETKPTTVTLLSSFANAWGMTGDAGEPDDAGGPVTSPPPPPAADAGTPVAPGKPPAPGTFFCRGFTGFTSAPGFVGKALAHGILPVPADGAQVGGVSNLGDPQKATFAMTLPVVAGSAHSAAPFAADFSHLGGLSFGSTLPFGNIVVSNFEIIIDSPTSGHVTALVNNSFADKITLFEIDPASIKPDATSPRAVNLHGLMFNLSAEGATRINTALKTDVFVPNEPFATADTDLIAL